ncbi:glycoside hydrolase family 3 N-terminal domain-containing protein [Sphingomonas tabacisoli]|uniref:beta-glucosidase n=1 Tax=Sphingomonas tabacisoli TaxID=2249466 RepID=A0ABW4I1M2_9SPHN
MSNGSKPTGYVTERLRIRRRSLLLTAGLMGAWAASPLRAAVAAVGGDGGSARIKALLAKMTLEEKAGQLTLMPPVGGGGAAAFNPAQPGAVFSRQLDDARQMRLGGVFNAGSVAAMRALQTAAAKESRLGIPLIFGADVIHGYKTIFPVPLGEASSFDPGLCERTARVAAIEASASGLDWTFAPMVDIARDARWGRGVEGAGEDPLLGSELARARVRGFQGRSLSDDDAVLACAKHFAAYGAAESGLDYNTVDISELRLADVYLRPFKAAFDAGALSTMASFNEINGVPVHANSWLLKHILRDFWKFSGLVVSDFTGDLELVAHGFAADEREAAKLAILGGVDMSMASGLYLKYLPDLVAKNEVPMERIDEAVGRLLFVKEQLGLLDDPFRRLDTKRPAKRIGRPEHIALAREAAQKSIVLLKNEGQLLPLPRTGKRLALIGPFAAGAHDLVGPWTVFGKDADCVDLATGLRAALGDAASLAVVEGSTVDAPLDGGIDAAVAAAKAADIVILAIGERTTMSGEASSRDEIVIPQAQHDLAVAVAATGKPTVVVLKNGRALALSGAVLDAPAIVVTWFLGSQTGHAIADVLFGKVGPSGRLPVSFPRSSGQVPYYYAHKSTGRPNAKARSVRFKTNFLGLTNTALFPFGHGLTYGDIVYSDLTLSKTELSRSGMLSVSALITNNGVRAADELAQLYFEDVAASLTQPVRTLKAYKRVALPPGKAQRVSFELAASQLAFLGADMRPHLEPGLFRVWIAPSAEAEGVSGQFSLVG